MFFKDDVFSRSLARSSGVLPMNVFRVSRTSRNIEPGALAFALIDELSDKTLRLKLDRGLDTRRAHQ